MRTQSAIARVILLLCSACGTTALLAQTNCTWTGAANGTNFSTAGNWNPAIVPNPCFQNTVQWDGVTTSNLFICFTNNPLCAITVGINFFLTSNQTNSVDLYSPSPSVFQGVGGFSVAANAGALSLGDNTPNNGLFLVMAGSDSLLHDFVNNSTNAATIYPNVGWEFLGGLVQTFAFAGSGNWDVTNYLIAADGSTLITKSGSGTLFWTGGNGSNPNPSYGSIGPVTINGGTIVLKSPNLLGLGQNTVTNNAFLEYDDVTGGFGTLSGSISGSGPIQVNNGTLTLSGHNTYTGSNILTGGELIAGSAESPGTSGPLGSNTVITFAGGTLGFSVSNTFDYSSRFDTSPNQTYNIDTAGSNVTFATGLGGSGGTLGKFGAGTLTLSGTSSYTGATTVSAGKLVFQGSKSGSGNISVGDGAALGVFVTDTQITAGTLSMGSSTGATLEFNDINSTTTAPIAAGTVTAGGTITININNGSFVAGQSYPLLTWTSGSPPPVTPGTVNFASGNLSTNGNTIQFNVTSLVPTWTGAINGDWDTSTAGNWTPGGFPPTTVWQNGESALFDDTATGTTTVTVNSPVMPSGTTVNTSNLSYSIASSGANNIGGTGGLIKDGTNTLTLSGGANTYTGATTINGGILSVSGLANGGSASDIGAADNSAGNLVLNGATLKHTGTTTSSDRLFTLGGFGATIDNEGPGTLNLTNAGTIGLTGSGPIVLTLTGINANSGTLGSVLTDGSGGATSLVKQGTGTWILTGSNTYTGGTTINSGTLQLGNGGPTGSLYNLGSIVDNSMLIFNSTVAQSYYDFNNDTITGTGNVIVRSGKVLAVSYNPYTGWTEIDAGAVFEPCYYESGVLLSSVVTNNGTLLFARLDSGIAGYAGDIFGTGKIMADNSTENAGDSTLTGTNFSTGGLVIAGGYLILGDNLDPFFGSMSPVGDIVFTNAVLNDGNPRGLILNRPDNFTFSNNILGKTVIGDAGAYGYNPGAVFLMGSGTVTLIGSNSYQGGTMVSNGALVVGGSRSSLGSGPVFDQTAITFNRSGTLNVPGNFGGPGTVAMVGSGVVNLTGSHAALAGSMAVSNGVLGVANSAGGDVDVAGGTLAVGGFQTVGTLAIGDSAVSPAVAANLNISSGTLSMALNTALAQSNSFVQMTVTNVLTTLTYNSDGSITSNTTITSATGAIHYTGGTLQLINVGPTLQVGQRFVLFSEPVTGGIPVVPQGNFTVNNNLAVDGSVTVATVAQPPSPKINNMSFQNGTNLVITATNNFGPGGTWALVGTNFLPSPVANWPVIMSGNFDANGNVILTLTNGATNGAQFFDLRTP